MVKAVEKAVEKVAILVGQVELVTPQVEEGVTIRRQRSRVELIRLLSVDNGGPGTIFV